MIRLIDKTSYCDTCCDDVEFETTSEIITVDLKGFKFSYGAIIPKCKNCSNELSISEVNDLNVIRAYKAQKESLEKEALEKNP